MLQQTQVATVIDYYHRFIERFPTPSDLADAQEEEVLSYWAGLGYYRRAKQLHKASKVIVDQYGGTFPSAFDDILALPGIGRYTAGAISSFAFEQRQPILEANTIRLYARLLAERSPPQNSAVQQRLWEFADAILPPRGSAATINQAVMELGSLVCVPKNPKCLFCPLSELCPTLALGLQDSIPAPKPKKQLTALDHGLVVIWKQQAVLLRRNQPGEWWEGLWDFPRTQIDTGAQNIHEQRPAYAARTTKKIDMRVLEPIKDSTEEKLRLQYGLECRPAEFLRTLKHGVTRYSITVYCFEASLKRREITKLKGDWKWFQLEELKNIPLTSTASRIAKSLEM